MIVQRYLYQATFPVMSCLYWHSVLNGLNENNDGNGTHPQSRLFAIASGKGGVGKTVITASLGVGLAKLKKRVIVVDADLAGANLHAAVGIERPGQTSYQFLRKDILHLNEALQDHPRFPNLKILSGAIGPLGLANLNYFQKLKFIRHIKKLDADFILIDLGAGSGNNVIDFFLAADHGIVVTNPNSLSILDSYNFLKLALLRKISREIKGHDNGLSLLKQIASSETHRTQMTMHKLVREIRKRDIHLGEKIVSVVSEFNPLLLVNMAMESKDENVVLALRAAVQELLAINVAYLGSVRKDATVEKALREMIPFIDYDSKSLAARDLANIVITQFIQSESFEAYRDEKVRQSRLIRIKDIKTNTFICSVECYLYWQGCSHKKGGYPCGLMSSIPHRKEKTG